MPMTPLSVLRRTVSWLLLSAVAAQAAPALKAGVFEPPRAAPDFVLRGSDGADLKLSRYRGQVVLLFFGFSHCAEVCPTTLATLAQARKALGGGGAAVQVLTSEDSVVDAGGGTLARVISLVLSDRSTMGLSQTGSAAFTVSRAQLPATFAQCTTACNITVANTTGSTRVTFANTPLSGNLVLNGTVDYARTTGSLSTSDSGAFTPLNSNISSLNASRKLTFSVLGSAAQTGLSLLTVEVIGGRVIQAQATMGIGTQVLSCFDNGSSIGIPACTGVTVGADGRTVTFANAVLRGGAVGVAARNVTFNGTVVVKGP